MSSFGEQDSIGNSAGVSATPGKGVNTATSAISSPLKYPSSSTGHALDDENSNPNQRPTSTTRTVNNIATTATDSARHGTASGLRLSDLSSPLPYPSSSLGLNSTGNLEQSQVGSGSSTATPLRNRRNDLVGNSQSFTQPQPQPSLATDQPGPVDGGGDDAMATDDPGAVKTFVWGTNVNPDESVSMFRDFLLNFTTAHRKEFEAGESWDPTTLDDEDRIPYYPKIIDQHVLADNLILNLDCRNLLAYPPARPVYDQLVAYPQEIVLNVLDFVVTTVFQEMYHKNVGVEQLAFKVKPFGLTDSVNLRELDPKDIDKLVGIKGFVIRSTNPIPELRVGFFKCDRCGHEHVVEVVNGRITEPTSCHNCDIGTYQMVYARSKFYDKQIIRLQETPDSVPDGQTPHTVSLVAYDEMVDCVKPGDRIEVTGIFKAMPTRVNPKQRVTRSIFKTYIDVLHIKSTEKKRIGSMLNDEVEGDYARIEHELENQLDSVTPAKLAKIKNIAKDENVFDRLARSLAPSIFGHVDAKKSVLLQLFGGTNKVYEKSQNAKHRGNIHVLLCGDPATSKSQILMYVHRLAPRGMYTSGKGSSAVGLTASVTRDPETRQLVLESGALVLSDGGICCIDEFDKMSDSTRAILHEAMEQQTVSVAKAGIITSLNARSSILAAANPLESKWNRKMSVVKNLNLPPTLLSRFDIVYLMLDDVDESHDSKLATHIMSLYIDPKTANANHEKKDIVDIETFAAYISYARNNIFPRMTDECIDHIAGEYVKIRQMGAMSATTRQLEALIRLSEAHAKMRLSTAVEKKDVDEAIRLIYAALRLSAMDPITGVLDPDLLTTGRSSRERKEAEQLRNAITDILHRQLRAGKAASITRDELLQMIRSQTSVIIRGEEFDKSLEEALGEESQISLRGNIVFFERV